jgi:hypothetical protein
MLFGWRWRVILVRKMGVVHSNVDVKAICRSSEMQILLDGMGIFLCYAEMVPYNGCIVDLDVYLVGLADALHLLL